MHIIYMSYMISYSLAVEVSEGDVGDDDDHSSYEDYEPSFGLSIRYIQFEFIIWGLVNKVYNMIFKKLEIDSIFINKRFSF